MPAWRCGAVDALPGEYTVELGASMGRVRSTRYSVSRPRCCPIDASRAPVIELPTGAFFTAALRDFSPTGAFVTTKRAIEIEALVAKIFAASSFLASISAGCSAASLARAAPVAPSATSPTSRAARSTRLI